MLREFRVLVLRRYLDEAGRWVVAHPTLTLSRGRPVSDVIKTQPRPLLFRCRPERDDAEISERSDRVSRFERKIPDPRFFWRNEAGCRLRCGSRRKSRNRS